MDDQLRRRKPRVAGMTAVALLVLETLWCVPCREYARTAGSALIEIQRLSGICGEGVAAPRTGQGCPATGRVSWSARRCPVAGLIPESHTITVDSADDDAESLARCVVADSTNRSRSHRLGRPSRAVKSGFRSIRLQKVRSDPFSFWTATCVDLHRSRDRSEHVVRQGLCAPRMASQSPSLECSSYLPVRLNLNFWPLTDASAIKPPFAIVNTATPLW